MSSSTAAGRLVGPPIARLLAADAPPPPARQPQGGALDSDGADWGTFADPCLALFLADGSTPPERLRGLLARAWDHDALTALKLVCNLRGVRGTGKGDREGFYTAALWMHENHPLTLAGNLSALAEFGYIKDFPELLYRLVKGPDVRKVEKAKGEAWWADKLAAEAEARAAAEEANKADGLAGRKRARSDDDPAPAPPSASVDLEPASRRRIEEAIGEPEPKPKPKPISEKAIKVATLAAQARQMYDEDGAYRTLFNCVADFFADRLRSDLENKAIGKVLEIGLASKWCPSPDSSFDQATLLCEAIARRLFPKTDQDQEESHYVYHVLRRLRREVLVPLRSVLKLPELYMSDQRWSELPYQRVASKAMERYHKIFMNHDEERFLEFLNDRDARKAKIADAAADPFFKPPGLKPADDVVLPHQLIGSMLAKGGGKRVPDWRYRVTWNHLVNVHRKGGLLRNCMAVCDLSAGMSGTRRNVCVALGLLVSELGEGAWAHLVYPFGADEDVPYIITDGGKLDIMRRLDVVAGEMKSADNKLHLRAVFDYILNTASFSVPSTGDTIRTIFVLTDQEFEQALVRRPWRKDFKRVCDHFQAGGFGDVVPQVVYWNLGGRRSAALTSMSDGVMRLSGFSDSFFRLFLKHGGIVRPKDEMYASIDGSDYDKLKVWD